MTVAGSLRVDVSDLTRALGAGQDRACASIEFGILVTTPAGYRLRVRPAQLDVERFERLADDGRRAPTAGQAEPAMTALRDALAIWRGPPFADLAFEAFAQAAIMRLEEQRLSVIEALGEAELAAGRHATLVGELQMLVRAHPTRERLAGQLMLALYRCGRQVDALDAYQQARRARRGLRRRAWPPRCCVCASRSCTRMRRWRRCTGRAARARRARRADRAGPGRG